MRPTLVQKILKSIFRRNALYQGVIFKWQQSQKYYWRISLTLNLKTLVIELANDSVAFLILMLADYARVLILWSWYCKKCPWYFRGTATHVLCVVPLIWMDQWWCSIWLSLRKKESKYSSNDTGLYNFHFKNILQTILVCPIFILSSTLKGRNFRDFAKIWSLANN